MLLLQIEWNSYRIFILPGHSWSLNNISYSLEKKTPTGYYLTNAS